MMALQSLSRPYPSRYGLPVLEQFDPRIYGFRYFGTCMDCTYCRDACCQYGADIETIRMKAILEHADDLEKHLGIERTEWFRTDPDDIGIVPDGDYPGGEYTRTGVVELPAGRSPHNEDACVFLDPVNRGCKLHGFALERGIVVHEIKPMICLLFPLSFTNRTLVPAVEFDDSDLVCIGPGPTIYQSAREDLRYYFGDELVAELDARAAEFPSSVEVAEKGLALPLVA